VGHGREVSVGEVGPERRGGAGADRPGGPGAPARGRRDTLVTLALALALSVFLMLVTMRASMRFGRLAHVPIWDDIGAFHDAADLLARVYAGGLKELVARWAVAPPHQPYATVMAVAAYAVFGFTEWAAYATTWVHVFVLLAMAGSLLSGFRLRQRLLGVALAATVPLMHMGVHEFKPDFFAAAWLAFGAVYALRRPLYAEPRRCAFVGVCLALCLFGKPSVFAQTGMFAAMILGLALIADWADGRPRPPLRRVLAGALVCAGVVALLFGPHFAFAAPHLWRYMMDNVFSERRALWVLPGGPMVHALHYVSGPGSGQVMLGAHLWVSGAFIAAGAVAALARRSRAEIVRAACLGVALLGLYLLPTLNGVKNHLLALPFQTLLVFGGLLALREVRLWLATRAGDRPARTATFAMLVAGLAVGLWTFDFRFYRDVDRNSGTGRAGEMFAHDAVAHAWYDEIARRSRGRTTTLLFANGVGLLNENVVGFWSIRDGLDLRLVVPVPTKAEDVKPYLRRADLVLAMDRDCGLGIDIEPRNRLLDDQLALVRAEPTLREVARFRVPETGKHAYLFQSVVGRGGFEGWSAGPGVGAEEGPYPQWQMPRVRWLAAPRATLRARCSPGPALLTAHAHSPMGTTARVLVDGVEAGVLKVRPAGDWVRCALPLTLPRGDETVTLEFDAGTPGQGVVLMKELRLGPDPGQTPPTEWTLPGIVPATFPQTPAPAPALHPEAVPAR
jgi:hypothetical protein